MNVNNQKLIGFHFFISTFLQSEKNPSSFNRPRWWKFAYSSLGSRQSYVLDLPDAWQMDHLLIVFHSVIKLHFSLLHCNKAVINSRFGLFLKLFIFFKLLGLFKPLLFIFFEECHLTPTHS